MNPIIKTNPLDKHLGNGSQTKTDAMPGIILKATPTTTEPTVPKDMARPAMRVQIMGEPVITLQVMEDRAIALQDMEPSTMDLESFARVTLVVKGTQ
jgi:hypothetical protein